MTERPILFNGLMVRALLDGAKTQTRRVIKPQPPSMDAVRARSGTDFSLKVRDRTAIVYGPVWAVRDLAGQERWECPYGQVGDRLWVRETFVQGLVYDDGCPTDVERIWYRADSPDLLWDHSDDTDHNNPPWKPSIHMPRWASRLTLEVTGVRAERVQDISEEDARAEGCLPRSEDGGSGWGQYDNTHPSCYSFRWGYKKLWNEINGERASWGTNPWVWVVEFKVVTT